MDFFFVEYRDPMFGLLVLVALVLVVAVLHYAWRTLSSKSQKKGLEGFIKKFDIADEHKDLLRASSLSLENLHFLAGIFTKSGEFEKAIQIYLIALEKIKDKGEQEAIFYDLAEVYFRAGFLQRSVEVLLNALNLRPRNEKALKLLKIVYLRLKRYDEVLQSLDALFELGCEVSKEREFINVIALKNGTQSGVLGEKNLSVDDKRNQNLALNAPNSALKSENSANLNLSDLNSKNANSKAKNLKNLNSNLETSNLNSKDLHLNLENSKSTLNLKDLNSATKNSAQSPKSYENNELVKRFLLENGVEIHAEFELVIDLLYKGKRAIFLDDNAYFELFCAMKLAPKRQNYAFTNPKLKMLEILNDNDFKARLSFSYVCTHCKNQMPLFFYHCPICYEFGGCKILYEVRDDEVR